MTSFKKQIKAPDTDTLGYWVKSGAPWVWLNAAAVIRAYFRDGPI